MSGISRSQRNVTLTTTQAEYMVMVEVVKDVLFTQGILKFVHPEVEDMYTNVYDQNQGDMQLANNPMSSTNSKHVDVRHHFLRELIRSDEIRITYVKSADQDADMITKPSA